MVRWLGRAGQSLPEIDEKLAGRSIRSFEAISMASAMLGLVDAELTSQIACLFPFPPLLMSCHSSYISPALRQPLHSFVGEVGSSSNIPSFISSSGLGRCCSFCSKLSARMCFCSSFCWPSMAGAAVESGRIFPVRIRDVSHLGSLQLDGHARREIGDEENFRLAFVRSTSSSRSGRFSNPFLKLSVACWRSSSNWVDCMALLLRQLCGSQSGGGCGKVCIRCGVCVTQDVPILEILDVGTHLEVFFEGFLTLDGGEGRLVDRGGGVFIRHVFPYVISVGECVV